MRMVFIGPPGAGKGTQAERLVKTYQMAHLSTGDMLRAARDAKTEVGLKAEKFMSSGALVPDDIIVAIIAERLATARLPARIPPGRLPADHRPGRSPRRDAGRKGHALGRGPGASGARGGVVPPFGRSRPGRRHARSDPPAAGGLSEADRAAVGLLWPARAC